MPCRAERRQPLLSTTLVRNILFLTTKLIMPSQIELLEKICEFLVHAFGPGVPKNSAMRHEI